MLRRSHETALGWVDTPQGARMRREVFMAQRRRRRFTVEFKQEAVRLCKQGDRSIGQVARELDLTESALRALLIYFGLLAL